MSVITKGLGSNLVTKGYGTFYEILREVIRRIARLPGAIVLRTDLGS